MPAAAVTAPLIATRKSFTGPQACLGRPVEGLQRNQRCHATSTFMQAAGAEVQSNTATGDRGWTSLDTGTTRRCGGAKHAAHRHSRVRVVKTLGLRSSWDPPQTGSEPL